MSNQTAADNLAIDMFACQMKSKMKRCADLGRNGWEDHTLCSTELLQHMLRECVAKGDPLDVAIIAMMLYHRGEETA